MQCQYRNPAGTIFIQIEGANQGYRSCWNPYPISANFQKILIL
ncbi:hypothetical protein Y023_4965 [Burkholderia pseudomallei A79D]|nr:hypothetical protein Y598_4907 [Burkholderia pseudomallei MSHR3335]KGX96743.1 hypothetical protein Y023_4965 [Burkholderia pseudomallei A79D]KGX97842.1 hypothetical protein X997_4640 [Burkholderia pseudomallei A79C]